jgi:uncharacterized protein (TIGR00251 family)
VICLYNDLVSSLPLADPTLMITPHPEGLVLAVRAQPGARRNGVQGEQAGALKVAVTAAPEQGKANRALVDVLREELGLKRSQLELLSGETSRDKRVLIRGLSRHDLEMRLAALLS